MFGQFHYNFSFLKAKSFTYWVKIIENEWQTTKNKRHTHTYHENESIIKQASHKYFSRRFPLCSCLFFFSFRSFGFLLFSCIWFYWLFQVVCWSTYFINIWTEREREGKNCLRFDNDSRVRYFMLNKLNKNYSDFV